MDFLKYKWIRLIIITVGVFIFLKYLFSYVFPFILGIVIVASLNPVLTRIKNRSHIGKGIMIGSILFLVGCIPGVVLLFAVKWLLNNVEAIQNGFDMLSAGLNDCIIRCCDIFASTGSEQREVIERYVDSGIQFIADTIEINVLPKLMSKCMGMIKIIGLVGTVWTVLLIFCIMLAKDYDTIRERCMEYTWFQVTRKIGLKIYRMLTCFFRSQLILMAAVSVVVAVGTLILGYKHWILIGIGIGFLDVLPFIGTGITLIPMAIWQFVSGNLAKGIGCLILYGLCVFIREYFEPKLLGKETGLHPIILLITIYLGVPLFGLMGIILGPVAYLLIVEVLKEWESYGTAVDKSEKSH